VKLAPAIPMSSHNDSTQSDNLSDISRQALGMHVLCGMCVERVCGVCTLQAPCTSACDASTHTNTSTAVYSTHQTTPHYTGLDELSEGDDADRPSNHQDLLNVSLASHTTDGDDSFDFTSARCCV
jgi:hypothetical protein